jgi:hypothetical protein
MPVYFVQEASGVGKAVFRPIDSAEDMFLCSIDLTAYSEPRVRDLFTELVNAVADHFRRVHAATVVAPASQLEGLPCATCESAEAIDVRFHAAQGSGALELSPGGFPAGCCKVRAVGGYSGGRSDTARPAARR